MNTVAELNDRFRQGDMTLGQYKITAGVQALTSGRQVQLIQLVRCFNQFTSDNTPMATMILGR